MSRATGHRMRVAVSVASLLWLLGCAATPAPKCQSGEQRMVSDLVYFGAATPSGTVTADMWAEFLATVVTPRFPQGLSVWQAAGQWKSADGSIVREPSNVLSLVHAGDATAERAIAEIVQAYKTRFQQEAVLRVKSAACASF